MNNVTGPGMLTLPRLYQTAGWLPTTVSCGLVGALSALAATFFCDSIALMPRNHDFRRRIEFCEPYKHHFGERFELVMHIAFYLTLLCQNIASIVEVAQVMDSLIAWGFGRSWAIEFMPRMRWVSWDMADSCDTEGSCFPFGTLRTELAIGDEQLNYGLLLTVGYVSTFLVLMPIGAARVCSCPRWRWREGEKMVSREPPLFFPGVVYLSRTCPEQDCCRSTRTSRFRSSRG